MRINVIFDLFVFGWIVDIEEEVVVVYDRVVVFYCGFNVVMNFDILNYIKRKIKNFKIEIIVCLF